jgi:hypothetical protein
VGGAAGAALVLLRARRRAHGSPGTPSSAGGPGFDRSAAERALRDLGRETRKLLGER